jgi:hypothetical protein
VWSELSRLSYEERGHRLDDFSNQLLEQQKNLAELKQANPNSERFRPLEGQLIALIQNVRREREREAVIAQQKQKEEMERRKRSAEAEEHELTPRPRIEEPIDDPAHMLSEQAEQIRQRLEKEEAASEKEARGLLLLPAPDELHAWLGEKERELIKRSEVVPGDLDSMRNEEGFYSSLLTETAERKQSAKDAEEKRAVDRFQKIVESKREQLTDSIRRVEMAVHKCVRSEEIADNHRRKLEELKNSDIDLPALQHELSVCSSNTE